MATARRPRRSNSNARGGGNRLPGSSQTEPRMAAENSSPRRRGSTDGHKRATGSQTRSRTSARSPSAGTRDRSTRRIDRDDAARGGRQRDQGSNSKSYLIMGAILVVVTISVTFALMWPGMQREMVLSRLDEATGDAAIAIADEYLVLVQRREGHVNTALGQKRGPVAAQIHLANELGLTSKMMLIALRSDNELSVTERAQALEAAAVLIEKNGYDGYIDIQRIADWALQPDAETIDVALCRGAAHLLAALKSDEGAEILAGVLADSTHDADVVDAAITFLPPVIQGDTVGHVLDLVDGPHGQAMRASPALMDAIANNIKAGELDRVFKLLDHEDASIQAVGARFLSGNGVKNATLQDRESVGRRLGPYLSLDARQEKPQVFSEALRAVRDVRLIGANDAVIALLPHVKPDHADGAVLVDILGKIMISKGDEAKPIANHTAEHLGKALHDPDARTTAARALSKVEVRNIPTIRNALEACAQYGDDSDCMAAAHHIVKQLYQRDDVISKLGTDAAAWQTFLAEDRPKYEEFMTINDFIVEYSDIRVTDPPERIDTAWTLVQKHTDRISQWLGKSGEPMPLGLTTEMLEDAQKRLGPLKYSIQKAKN